MIYRAVESTLLSLAHQCDELADAIIAVQALLQQNSQHESAGNLSTFLQAARRQGARLRDSAAQVRDKPSMAGVLEFALNELRATRELVRRGVTDEVKAASDRLAPSSDVARYRSLIDAVDDVATEAVEELEAAGSWPSGPSYNIGRIRGAVDDIASYPILTADLGGLGGSGGLRGGSAAPGAGRDSLQRIVDGAIQQTLGRLPRHTDSTAFVAALNASFDRTEVAGRSVVTWRPRSYVGQTELGGAVTGAQASLYARARDSLAAVLPLLDGLTPLRADVDVEEMDAARSIIQAEFSAVVNELGAEGGPRVPRVDDLFEILLKQDVIGIGNKPVRGGMVGYLSWVFGLESGRVNTVAEEQNLSSFLLLQDHIVTVEASWKTFRDGSFGRDLGTRLVLLSTALQVVAESTDEVVAALDSVFVGSAERNVAQFRTSDGRAMLVSELLSWIASFAGQEARELVQQGGRRAMGAVITTAGRLGGLVEDLLGAIGFDPGLPAGMRHPRVRHPLNELRAYLRRVDQLAQDVRVA
ncbi:hypothetical protein Ga0074812_11863 [Parafrankia irregularis]|uniref:Uncharacterized protein n=1 Tax=Parafrankia irregularis TaxID=795642 RepID=A0A0S4QS20_9ACTN|nr:MULTISPECIES: hypothetical protein [Parafrankia]MBE3201810.1 hypothetical protein [Parafrankia sp. CH37]CUU58291.1 hypothetical protein Ga0074812_11863 [Parafrankia irregularis]